MIKDQLHRQILEQAIVDGLKIYFFCVGLAKICESKLSLILNL